MSYWGLLREGSFEALALHLYLLLGQRLAHEPHHEPELPPVYEAVTVLHK